MAKEPDKAPKKSAPAPIDGDQKELAQEIAKRIGSLVPQNQQAQVVAQVVSLVQEERFSGPIAHPRHLREYEEIVPGSADRIIAMAEKNLQHAHTMQSKALDSDVRDMRDGRYLGFAALVVLILSALVCGYLGNNTLALAFLGAGALGTIGQIIKGRSRANDD